MTFRAAHHHLLQAPVDPASLAAAGFGVVGVAACGAVLTTARTAAITAEIGFCLVADTRPVLKPLEITELYDVLARYPDFDHASCGSSRASLHKGQVKRATAGLCPQTVGQSC
jgi:hypothetical protein